MHACINQYNYRISTTTPGHVSIRTINPWKSSQCLPAILPNPTVVVKWCLTLATNILPGAIAAEESRRIFFVGWCFFSKASTITGSHEAIMLDPPILAGVCREDESTEDGARYSGGRSLIDGAEEEEEEEEDEEERLQVRLKTCSLLEQPFPW